MSNTVKNCDVLNKLTELYDDVFSHDGYGEIRIEIKIQRRGQKEVILHCGKQHRYVVDYQKSNSSYPSERHQVISRKPRECSNKTYIGAERRSSSRRINRDRRIRSAKRDFKLERRISPDRRASGERRALKMSNASDQKEKKEQSEWRRGVAQ